MDNTTPQQIFSLRSHENSISNIEEVFLWNKHCLISSDTKGWIIIWNINAKRPIRKWQAHDETILTLTLISTNTLLTHGRDASLKIWDISVEHAESSPPELFFLPINTLNFCNVQYFNDFLITPASVDSNNFDIYKITNPEYEFKRVLANFSPFDLYSKNKTEINSPNEQGRNDFGIIMKLVYVEHSNQLFLGFESGQIIGLNINLNPDATLVDKTTEAYSKKTPSKYGGLSSLIDKTSSRTLINKEPRVNLIYSDSSHIPNPITSLVHLKDNILISGSTNKQVIVHHYQMHSIDSSDAHLDVKKVAHSGIQSIVADEKTDTIFIGHWNGVIEGVDYKSNKKKLDSQFELKRDLPHLITTSTNSSGGDTNTIAKEAVKLTSLALLIERENTQVTTTKKKSYKDLVKARSAYIGNDNRLLFAGYEDGAVVAYRL